jgi:hypothetical protein
MAIRELHEASIPPTSRYRAVLILDAALGLTLTWLFAGLSRAADATRSTEKKAGGMTLASLSGLDRSRPVVMKLAGLFALDAFAGRFVIKSFAAYWFICASESILRRSA